MFAVPTIETVRLRLRPWRDEDVDAWAAMNADPRVTEFTDWFEAKLAAHDIDALLDYRRQAPHAVLMHPTDEHLLPVFAALGAADDDYTLGIQSLGTYQKALAMTNYVFGTA